MSSATPSLQRSPSPSPVPVTPSFVTLTRGDSPSPDTAATWLADHTPKYHESKDRAEEEEEQQAIQLQEAEDDAESRFTVKFSRTLLCIAPRHLLWRAMMTKIREPQRYREGIKEVKIVCESPDLVYRSMVVLPLNDPAGSTTGEIINEKITWDEAQENVRFELYEDELKSGFVQNEISSDRSGSVCLTVSCHWVFNPSISTVEMQRWRAGLRRGVDAGCAQTVRMVEAEAKELAKTALLRRRTSQSQELLLNEKLLGPGKPSLSRENSGNSSNGRNSRPGSRPGSARARGEIQTINVAPKPGQ